jgi:hypothetical protein
MASPKRSLSPVTLRLALFGTIALLVVIAGIVFWFLHGQLVDYANEVNSDATNAAASNQDAIKLQQLQKQLEDNQVAVTRAKNIVADSQYYQYQNQIISDISAYASVAGMKISSFTFNDAGTGTAPAAAPTTPAGQPTATPAASLHTTSAMISFGGSVGYQNIMNFIRSLEQNLTKMQVGGVSLQFDRTTGQVSVGSLTIEVYTR